MRSHTRMQRAPMHTRIQLYTHAHVVGQAYDGGHAFPWSSILTINDHRDAVLVNTFTSWSRRLLHHTSKPKCLEHSLSLSQRRWWLSEVHLPQSGATLRTAPTGSPENVPAVSTKAPSISTRTAPCDTLSLLSSTRARRPTPGHTMVYYPNTDGAVTILNPMDGDAEYTLAQFHCHWDASAFRSNLGSEHTLDEHPYPLECHFVHYRTAYDTLGEAVTHSDGLMVVGQFYEIDDDADNPELDKFLDAADNVIEVGSNYTLTENLAITPFVTNNSHVYTYSGSLTTPTCNEVVQWYVFRTPMGVPLAKLEKLWALDKDNASTIEHNWRPTQPLNGRTVHRNFAYTRYGNNDDADGGISTGDHSGAMRTSPTTSSVALACLLSIVIVAFVC